MGRDIKWGIIAPGRIARLFSEGLNGAEGSVLYAVASRALERAKAFAEEFHAEKVYGSYEELVSDPDVDIIYVANIHPQHFEAAKLALNAGKAVLCEKPITLNAKQAEELISIARKKNVFLMEAMWMRYNPALNKAKELITAGRIGKIIEIRADFSKACPPNSRQIVPELGGGALLDLGIYPISLATWLIGRFPDEITSECTLTSLGVDGTERIIFKWESGEKADLKCSVETDGHGNATIVGTVGCIEVHAPFHVPEKFTLTTASGNEVFSFPLRINGYEYEAAEVTLCLKAGLKESPVMTLDETLATMKLMDALRAQWGVVYPAE